jgi:hypothetical protein
MKKIYLLLLTSLFWGSSLGAGQAQDLLHYWNFNTTTSFDAHLAPSFTQISGAGISHVQEGASLIDLEGGTGQNFNIQNLNARFGDPAGNHLRFNEPLQGRLIFSLPTTGFQNIVLQYVTRRSGSGAGTQVIEYSLNGTTYTSFAQRSITETPTLHTFDFSGTAGAADNPSFKVRVSFLAEGGGTVGNNRFDNVTLVGSSLSGGPNPPAPVNPPVVSLSANLVSVSEADGKATVKVLVQNPSAASVDLVLKHPAQSTAGPADFTFTSRTLSLDGTTTEVVVDIPIINDTEAEADEYFFLQLENPVGCSISGTPQVTVYIRDNDRLAKVPSREIRLAHVGSVDVKTGPGANSAEIAAHDPASQRLFVVNSLGNSLVIMSFANPAAPAILRTINMAPYGLGINGVAVKNGVVACAVESKVSPQDNGSVVFLSTDGNFLNQVTVGAMPDMITFTPDGKKVLTANEGEPNNAYTIDPEGSVSIIDISRGLRTLSQSSVTTLTFAAYDGQEEQLRAQGIRAYPGRQFSKDAEPEYITVSDDSKTAWVVLQENNAFAVIDLKQNVLTDLWPLGYKDHMAFGSGLDASDQGGQIHLANWPIKGVYMPDAIANYKAKGKTYLVGANEGDDREWSGDNERRRFAHADINLDPAVFPHADFLKQNFNLGRLNVTKASGRRNSAGQFAEVHLIGGRSFAIWNADTKELVYDSGDDFELFFAQHPEYRHLFNSNHEANNFKARSSSKGPEPEGVVLAQITNKTYAFVSLERMGGIMVYDITDPTAVRFVDYTTSRRLDAYGGDNGTEGIIYIDKNDSPDGQPYLVCANEVSSTVSVYQLTANARDIHNPVKQVANSQALGNWQEQELVVYPNPATHVLHLNQVTSVEVFDLKGSRLLQEANTANIQIDALPKGIYVLRTAEGVVKRFVKE